MVVPSTPTSLSRRKRRKTGIDQNGQRADYWHYVHQEIPEPPSATPVVDAWLKEWYELFPPKDGEEI